ncbi:unnamed protein product [marine sediment metagenome]|uniref:Uncharacterized protein n=1 Tax=marine sediment metagenome TaxID=412755 RepID=X1GXZ6_9ZZZZ
MTTRGKQWGEKVKSIRGSYQRDKGLLVSIWQDTQVEYNYLLKLSTQGSLNTD